jgi:D-tyrosyl-tRNA(Tyr) deacylase
MRVVLQRVASARVRRLDGDSEEAGIDTGLLLLAGFCASDTPDTLRWMAEKCAGLRVFEDGDGAMNRAVDEVGGAILVVPNFTLYGDARKGRRPSFSNAAPPQQAAALFDAFVDLLRGSGVSVQVGFFQSHMRVALENDGPVTLFLER